MSKKNKLILSNTRQASLRDLGVTPVTTSLEIDSSLSKGLESPRPKTTLEGSRTKRMFKDARKTLEERGMKPPQEPVQYWDESHVEYVKRYKRENREALLLECVPERKCPVCGELRLRSAQWVFVTRKHLDRFKDMPKYLEIFEAHLDKVICRSCVTAWNYERRRLEGRSMGRRKEKLC